MRTLLIAPAFLAVFATVALLFAWLVSAAGSNSQEFVNFPPRDAFARWDRNLPIESAMHSMSAEEAYELIDDEGLYAASTTPAAPKPAETVSRMASWAGC